MNTKSLAIAAFVAALTSAALTRAADISASQVLHGNVNTCEHVIDLLHRYGSGNHVLQHAGVVHTSGGPAVIPNSALGDIRVGDVTLVAEGLDGCGPRIAVQVCNYSTREVCNFSVSAVTILHRIFPHAPSVTQKIDKICAGESIEVELQLPIESLAMGLAGATPIAFKTLIVAVDSYDELLECNESNNLHIVHRSKLPVRVVAQTQVETKLEATAEAPAGSNVAAPSPPSGPSAGKTSLDDLDLDNLQLQDTAVQLATR